MNTVLRTSLLATAMLAAVSIHAVHAAGAADAATGRPAKPAPGPVMEAMQSLARDMQADQDPRLPLPGQLERAAAFRPAPATAAKLIAVFGTDRPYTIERRPAKAGRQVWRARLQPLHYTGGADVGGARTDWDEALIDLDMDKAGKTVDFTGHWNTLATEDATMRLSAEGIALSGQQRRSEDKLWFGNGQLRIARVRGATPQTSNAGTDLSLDDLRMDWHTVAHPKTVDMQFRQRIGSIAAAGEKVEDVRFDIRVVNIDRASMVALQAAGERQRQQLKTMTPEQQLAAMKPMFQDLGKAAIARGSRIEIDEISARYRGNKASIRGSIGAAGASEADLGNLPTLAKKIVARFEIRVPVAMVRDVAGVIAEKQAKQPGAAPNPMPPAQVGQTITDVIVGKLVGGGYARVENDVLVSNVEFRDGKLTANGKPVELTPQVKAMPPMPVVSQRSSLPANALQARRIDDSCRLPDFPDEVIAQDKALHAGFAWRVDETGKVENVRVTAASGYPGWDQNMIAVLGQCRYIPALQDGKPLGLQIDWNVARTPGGPRSPVPAP